MTASGSSGNGICSKLAKLAPISFLGVTSFSLSRASLRGLDSLDSRRTSDNTAVSEETNLYWRCSRTDVGDGEEKMGGETGPPLKSSF